MTVLIVAIIIATSVWAGIDASKLQADQYKLHNGGPATFLACLLLWIIIFPVYLFKRSKIVKGTAILKKTGQPANMDTGFTRKLGALPASPGPQLIAKIILGCLPVLVVIMIAMDTLNPSLPGCGDQQVQNLVIQILNKNIIKGGYDPNDVSMTIGLISNTGINRDTKGLTCRAQITFEVAGEDKEERFINYQIDKSATNKKEFIVSIR